ncbi:hypothetical protein BAUCODRAFT_28038 [Baudoinia panamericana UAMH 10762]|uniref:RING-type domain-containing protein n=1 Tax=Baudoinia panamericana (strain UAMH 10762) TaxID=717646 RepID=M2LCT6_BAUPA|nr:uncharacterized protein BAUCODRAFT_28038 [Baudoinia panamericana UAMH 10762]EMC91787.1 hypothetical protein BAUCODRAFT_28038 [Baudoinia panamericana UAMH 10762]
MATSIPTKRLISFISDADNVPNNSSSFKCARSGHKQCSICCDEVSSLKVTPTTCAKQHSEEERSCSECWDAYISDQIKMFQAKRSDGPDTPYQKYNRARDGRIFTCKVCAYQTCTDCDRPEHVNETCDEYQTRYHKNPAHSRAEAATSALDVKNEPKQTPLKICPSCTVLFELKKCGHTVCACGHRFCGRCLRPWTGEGSAFLCGRFAHRDTCLYRERATNSGHTLHGRSAMLDEVYSNLVESARRAGAAVLAAVKAAWNRPWGILMR